MSKLVQTKNYLPHPPLVKNKTLEIFKKLLEAVEARRHRCTRETGERLEDAKKIAQKHINELEQE